MILPLVLLLMAALAVFVTVLLMRNTTSQTAQVLTIIACVFVLWSLVEIYFEADMPVNVMDQASSGGELQVMINEVVVDISLEQ